MKITSSRKNIKASSWSEEFDRRAYELKSTVEQYLSEFNLQFDVNVNGQSLGRNGYEVSIYVNDTNKFNDNVSLSWDFNIQLDDEGNVKMKSGSWSGLQATTVEQLADLKESVRCIEFLHNMDWKDILSVRQPDKDEFPFN